MPNGSISKLMTMVLDRLRTARRFLRDNIRLVPLFTVVGIGLFVIVATVGWLYKFPMLIYGLIVIALITTNTVTYLWAEHLLAQKERTSVPVSEHKLSKDRLNALNAITRILASSEGTPAAMTELIAVFCNAFHWDFGAFWQLDKDYGVLQCRAVWHKPSVDVAAFQAATKPLRFTIGRGLPGRTWRSRETEWIENISSDESFIRLAEARANNLNSAFALPVFYGDRFLGALEFFSAAVRGIYLLEFAK